MPDTDVVTRLSLALDAVIVSVLLSKSENLSVRLIVMFAASSETVTFEMLEATVGGSLTDVTVTVNVCVAVALLASVAVTVMVVSPCWLSWKANVSSLPDTDVVTRLSLALDAVIVRESPSKSENLSVRLIVMFAASSETVTSWMLPAAVGASFTGVTVTVNVCVAVALLASVAVTVMVVLPYWLSWKANVSSRYVSILPHNLDLLS